MSENINNKHILMNQKILILTEEDFHKKSMIIGYHLDLILIPINKKEEFEKSYLKVSLMPVLSIFGKVAYY